VSVRTEIRYCDIGIISCRRVPAPRAAFHRWRGVFVLVRGLSVARVGSDFSTATLAGSHGYAVEALGYVASPEEEQRVLFEFEPDPSTWVLAVEDKPVARSTFPTGISASRRLSSSLSVNPRNRASTIHSYRSDSTRYALPQTSRAPTAGRSPRSCWRPVPRLPIRICGFWLS
jgi:hypothetical protein